MSMNAKQAQKIVEIIQAYRKTIPLTLFVYGDFVELFPDVILSWNSNSNINIGIRGATQYPAGHLEHMGTNWVREGVVSSQLRLSELGISSSFYMPPNRSGDIRKVAKAQGITIIRPSAAFPPFQGKKLLCFAFSLRYIDMLSVLYIFLCNLQNEDDYFHDF